MIGERMLGEDGKVVIMAGPRLATTQAVIGPRPATRQDMNEILANSASSLTLKIMTMGSTTLRGLAAALRISTTTTPAMMTQVLMMISTDPIGSSHFQPPPLDTAQSSWYFVEMST